MCNELKPTDKIPVTRHDEKGLAYVEWVTNKTEQEITSFSDQKTNWTMRWDRENLTFSVKFDHSWFEFQRDKDAKIAPRKQMLIAELQTLLAAFAITGDEVT